MTSLASQTLPLRVEDRVTGPGAKGILWLVPTWGRQKKVTVLGVA